MPLRNIKCLSTATLNTELQKTEQKPVNDALSITLVAKINIVTKMA